jgi:D-3-phosphoglycerate dehydrogenase
MTRIGSALFNADHTRLGEELRRAEAAGVDFFHLDVFDGYFVHDQAFPARTIKALRPLTKLPFEVHLAVNQPERFLPALKDAGADLVFLPAESTPLLYETIYSVRELGLKPGLVLGLGTPLTLLDSTLPMLDAVLLLGRVTGEGKRGRDFNQLVLERVRAVRRMIDERGLQVDLQAAGGLETAHCVEVVQAGVTSLPLGAALHREPDMAAYLAMLRALVGTRSTASPHFSSGAQATETASREIGPPVSPVLPLGPSSPQGKCRDAVERVPTAPWHVLVASRSFGKNCSEVLEQLKAAGCVFLPSFDKSPSEEQLIARVAEADVIVSGTEPLTARVLAAAPRLKLIAKHGIGVDNIDLAAAKQRGIPVAVAGPAMVDAVADLAMGLLLACARQIPQGNAGVKAGQWERFVGPELRGKTLGLVGLGQIGKAVARRAKGFGLELVAFDAFPDADFAASWRVRYVSFDELLAQSDFISIHAPLTPQTKHLFNAAAFAKMKPGSYLINTSRGELVDEAALYDALTSKRLAGAACDVFAKEPPDPTNALLALDNFIATPHCGGQTAEALRRMGEITAENIRRVLREEEPLFQVR